MTGTANAPRYAVMLHCRTGTHRLVGDHWEDVYHVVTWGEYGTLEEAAAVASEHRANRQEVLEAWPVIRSPQ